MTSGIYNPLSPLHIERIRTYFFDVSSMLFDVFVRRTRAIAMVAIDGCCWCRVPLLNAPTVRRRVSFGDD
jgi:hypothetical protein